MPVGIWDSRAHVLNVRATRPRVPTDRRFGRHYSGWMRPSSACPTLAGSATLETLEGLVAGACISSRRGAHCVLWRPRKCTYILAAREELVVTRRPLVSGPLRAP